MNHAFDFKFADRFPPVAGRLEAIDMSVRDAEVQSAAQFTCGRRKAGGFTGKGGSFSPPARLRVENIHPLNGVAVIGQATENVDFAIHRSGR